MMGKLYRYNGTEVFDNTLVYPEDYGAVGDGITNDTQAIQSAVNQKGHILFRTNMVYKITSPIRIKKDTIINLNGATILSTNKHAFFNFEEGDSYSGYNGNGNITIENGFIVGGCISFIHGYDITLRNIKFKNVLNDHFVEICACNGYLVEGCSFVGMQNIAGAALEYINIDTNASYPAFPHNKAGQNDPVFYDMSTNKNLTFRDCYFSVGSDAYAYGFNAIGVHSRNVSATYAENVTIENNHIVGFTGCGIRVNAMDGAYILDNNINAVGDGIRVGDVADAKNVVIKGNYVVSGGNNLVLTSGQYASTTVVGNYTSGTIDPF